MLLASDTGFDDLIKQGQAAAKEVVTLDAVVSADDVSGSLQVGLGLSASDPILLRTESKDVGVCFSRR